MFLSTALIFTLMSVSYGANMPQSFKKCNRKQADLKKCLLDAAQTGVPRSGSLFKQLNLVNMDPFEVPKVDVGGTGKVNVQQHFKNCKIFGLPLAKFEVFDWDLEKKTLRAKGVFPEIKKMCHYQLDGQVLLLPIKGEGPSTVILYNTTFDVDLLFEERKKKGKTYEKIVSTKLDFEPALVSFNFENLFDGDKHLGNNINKVLNDNWKEVFDDVKSSYSVIINEVVTAVLNSFFAKLALEELLD